MKIVVLDGYTLNSGDISWNSLEALGDLTVYDRTPYELIIERLAGAEVVLTNKTPLTKEILDHLPDLRYVGVLATGYNVIDIHAASNRGITVTNVPAYSTGAVAQLVFALLLELTSQVAFHSKAVRDGEWAKSLDFSFTKTPLMELEGKTFGIIGFGQIGQQVAKIAHAFGMRVLVSSRTVKDNKDFDFVYWTTNDELFHKSDVLSLHCPQTPETEGLVNNQAIARMKSSTLILNTSRGGLIVEQDLADALNEGRIAGAGLDVLSTEPPSTKNPLLTAKNCLVTPHIGWATKESRKRLMDIAVDNVKAFLMEKLINVVNQK